MFMLHGMVGQFYHSHAAIMLSKISYWSDRKFLFKSDCFFSVSKKRSHSKLKSTLRLSQHVSSASSINRLHIDIDRFVNKPWSLSPLWSIIKFKSRFFNYNYPSPNLREGQSPSVKTPHISFATRFFTPSRTYLPSCSLSSQYSSLPKTSSSTPK